MNLLIINISLRPESPRHLYPIGLAYVASSIKRAGYKFDIIDLERDKKRPQSIDGCIFKKYDVIAFGAMVSGYKYVKELSHHIHRYNPNAIQICGNTISTVPHILKKHTFIDRIIMGEGEHGILSALVSDVRHMEISNTTEPNIDKFSIDWDIFKPEGYIHNQVNEPFPIPQDQIRAFPINTARGCINKCTFCYHAFYGQRYRYHSVQYLEKVIGELKDKYKLNYITFYDDLTLFSRKRAKDFASMLTGMGVFWTACCRADLFTREDRKLIAKMKKSGCVSLGYALENANPEILKAMKKNIDLDDFAEQKRALDEYGIATLNCIIIGYPQETTETIKETFQFCYDIDNYPTVGYLLPQPGTPIYQYALQHKYILNEEEYLLKMGDRQDLTLNLTNMSDELMENTVIDCLKGIRDKLRLPLDDEHLIKTGRMRQSDKTNPR